MVRLKVFCALNPVVLPISFLLRRNIPRVQTWNIPFMMEKIQPPQSQYIHPRRFGPLIFCVLVPIEAVCSRYTSTFSLPHFGQVMIFFLLVLKLCESNTLFKILPNYSKK